MVIRTFVKLIRTFISSCTLLERILKHLYASNCLATVNIAAVKLHIPMELDKNVMKYCKPNRISEIT